MDEIHVRNDILFGTERDVNQPSPPRLRITLEAKFQPCVAGDRGIEASFDAVLFGGVLYLRGEQVMAGKFLEMGDAFRFEEV